MALNHTTTLKLIPAQFRSADYQDRNMLVDEWGAHVHIEIDRCDICYNKFMGTIHDDPGENPIEVAISYCGCDMNYDFDLAF